jgi:DNA helicase-2/ATP-dependent DNA helicase PcrA
MHGEHVGLDRSFTIYDSSDQLTVVKESMKRIRISVKEFSPKTILSYISTAKNQLINPEQYVQYAQGYFQQIVSDVYPEYQKILRENNAVDFDDLIMKTIELLEKNESIRESFKSQFKYILVDEYQDTNHAQYRMIKILTDDHKNICVVGDDDQSIYAFRGATIKNILSFEIDYPNCVVIKLEQNYRSTKKILEASYQVISKNSGRKDKKLWTDNNDGNKIIVYTAHDEIDEARWVVENIGKNSKEVSFPEVAVLYRTNAQSRSLEESFIQQGIPYKIVGGVRFYERKEIKDILAYLRLIFNEYDNTSFERVVNVPRRGIGKKTLAEISHYASEKNLSYLQAVMGGESATFGSGPTEFGKIMADLVQASKTKHLVDFINYLLERTGYMKMLDDGTLENQTRIENIKELITVASAYDHRDPLEGLESFLDDVSLLEGMSQGEQKVDGVTLMTIHSAKGLEFRHVYVVGMEENLFPHSNTLFNEDELEEERRLAYVAITRAKEQLHLVHTDSRKYFGSIHTNPPSRFLTDIDEELIDLISPRGQLGGYSSNAEHTEMFSENINLEEGQKVKHEYFGIGTVKYIDDELIEVDFGSVYGVKELMLEYARLEKV